jgi:transposase InsO family protein
MRKFLFAMVAVAQSSLKSRRALALENLALRQQLAVLRRHATRPKLSRGDRVFWVILARVWPEWRTALTMVQPATVIRWHRKGFALYWTWKSRKSGGRPRKDAEIRALIRQMARDNVGWGAPRIHGELRKLGVVVSEATVSRTMPRRSTPPSQTWRTFLANHLPRAAAIDFFVVPTATFRLLYVVVILAHERRRIVHFDVTDAPCARWTGQQVINAFPYETAPRYLHRDRDGIYGSEFISRVRSMGIEQVVSAARSPWQNPYVERVIGSLRRECTDHLIVTGAAHLRRVLREYVAYYNADRTHVALNKDSPATRPVLAPGCGKVIALPRVGGLHHRYERRAA